MSEGEWWSEAVAFADGYGMMSDERGRAAALLDWAMDEINRLKVRNRTLAMPLAAFLQGGPDMEDRVGEAFA